MNCYFDFNWLNFFFFTVTFYFYYPFEILCFDKVQYKLYFSAAVFFAIHLSK